jgi:hypothetical protein
MSKKYVLLQYGPPQNWTEVWDAGYWARYQEITPHTDWHEVCQGNSKEELLALLKLIEAANE